MKIFVVRHRTFFALAVCTCQSRKYIARNNLTFC
jgi:hypothetical protein